MMDVNVEKIIDYTYSVLKKVGLSPTFASYTSAVINLVLMMVLTYIIFLICKFTVIRLFNIVAHRTKTNFDDLLVSNKTAKYISHLIPLLFV